MSSSDFKASLLMYSQLARSYSCDLSQLFQIPETQMKEMDRVSVAFKDSVGAEITAQAYGTFWVR